MVMLRGFLVLTAFFVIGEALRVMLALPISGGVLGMILLTLLLMVRGSISDSLANASQALISVADHAGGGGGVFPGRPVRLRMAGDCAGPVGGYLPQCADHAVGHAAGGGGAAKGGYR